MYRKLLNNSIFNAIGKFGTMIANLVLTPIVISRLGEDRYAIWSLMTLIISYIGFLDFGVSGAYSKYIAEYHAKETLRKINGVIVCGIALYSLISIVVVLTGIPLVQFTPQIFKISTEMQPEALTTFRIGIIVFVLASTFNVFEAIPVGLQRMEYNNSVSVFSSLIYCVVSILYLSRNGGLIGLMLIRAGSTVLQIALNAFNAFRLLPSLNLSPKYMSIEQVKELISFGLKVQAGKLANFGITNINKILAGVFGGLSGVANYQIGASIVQGVRSIAMITFSGVTPMASKIEAQNRHQDLLGLYHNGIRISLVVSGLGFGLICAVADPLITLWTGKQYPVAVLVLISLALSNFIHVSTGTGTCITRGIGRPGLETVFGVVLLSINSIFGWVFGRFFGIQGILGATLIAYFSSSLIFLYWFNRVIGFSNSIFFRKVILPPTISLLLGLLIEWVIRYFAFLPIIPIENVNRLNAFVNILINGSTFIIIFSLLLFITGYIRLHHIKVVKNFIFDIPALKAVTSLITRKS